MRRRTTNSTDRGATDPILVIAAIAVSLALLVGGTFATAKLIANGKDLNAKGDLDKVAVAETALRTVATESGDDKPGTKWTGAPNASTSTFADRTNFAAYPNATTLTPPATEAGFNTTRGYGSGGGGAYTLVGDATDGPEGTNLATYIRKTWKTKSTASNNTGIDVTPAGTGTAIFSTTPGDIWTISAYLRASETHTDGKMWARFTTTSGTTTSPVYGTTTTLTAGQWTRVSVTVTAPAGTKGMFALADVGNASGWSIGATLDGTGLLLEKSAALGSYFDGDTSPKKPASKGFIPYVTDSTATALATNLKPTGGSVAGTDLAKGSIGFTQSDGSRLAVLTDSAGSAWAAVAKSTTGSLFLRTSASSRIADIGGTSGARTIPAGFPLPDGITVADINTALTNASGF